MGDLDLTCISDEDSPRGLRYRDHGVFQIRVNSEASRLRAQIYNRRVIRRPRRFVALATIRIDIRLGNTDDFAA